MFKQVLATGADLVLPRPCPGCGGPEPWCENCARTLDHRPRSVRMPEATLDSAEHFELPPVWAIARYSAEVRAAIIAGKERGRRDLPARLGVSVGHALIRLITASQLSGGMWIVPAPSRRAAARSRGGDPVLAMARAAAAVLAMQGIPAGVAPCLFTAGRARDSVGLDAMARAANLAGRIRVRRAGLPPVHAQVVLLDDVVTSGATVVASATALHSVGVQVRGVLAVATATGWVATP